MLTTGSKLDAREALSCGLIDRITPEPNLLPGAADIALSTALARPWKM
jgi:enoyl-CoA hydratase/carnithine racemase